MSLWLERAYPDPEYRAQVVANWERDVSVPERDVYYTITAKDGAHKEMLLHAQLLPHEQMIVMMIDMSEHMRVQRELRESEERYRNLIDSLPVGVVVHTGGLLVFANRAASRIVGVDGPDELVGGAVSDIVHPDYRELAFSRAREIIETKTAQPPMEEQFLRADGSPVV